MATAPQIPLPYPCLPVQTARGLVTTVLDTTTQRYLLQRDGVTVKSWPRSYCSYGLLSAERDRLVTAYGGEIEDDPTWPDVGERARDLAQRIDDQTGGALTVRDLIGEVLRQSADMAQAQWGQRTLCRRVIEHQTRVHRQYARWQACPDYLPEWCEAILAYDLACPSMRAKTPPLHCLSRW